MNIRYKINIYRRYFSWRAKECIFIHVPKAAGTSINHALYGRTLGHYKAGEVRAAFPQLYKRAFVFSLVRNPWDRAVSAYRFARAGTTGNMGITNPSYYQRREFRTFESFVNEWLCFQDLQEADFVFQPQMPFLTDKDGALIVDYVGRVEQMEDAIETLNHALSKQVSVSRLNSTASDGTYRDYYTSPELVDLVAQIYKEDIEFFNYAY